jgi:dynein heavy chain, axonemal
VFLANCHLMTSWLPSLDKIVEGLRARKPHPNFRLWLSSSPSPAFPIAILQRGLKMTTEPPKGLRANLLRLYGTIDEASYAECKTTQKYQKLLFTLAYFHSVLLERRKFRTLGLNIPYDFNDTDFRVSDDLLKSYLDAYKNTPWDALRCVLLHNHCLNQCGIRMNNGNLHPCFEYWSTHSTFALDIYTLAPLQIRINGAGI